jgi:serine/threonine-protein kinase
MAVAGAVVLAGTVRAVQVISRPPLCRGAAQQLAGIWDGPRSEAVRRAFAGSGKGYAAEAFARVRAILDDYAATWERMYADACEATHLRGEQSSEVLDLRMACLKDNQGELRALTDLFSSPDGDVVSRSIMAASALAPVNRCADVRVLRAVVRPPDDRETRAQVESLRQRLAEVKALHGAGRLVEATNRAVPLVAAARAIGYEPLLAEALATLGHVEYLSAPNESAESALNEAMLVAEGSRHDRLLAEAAVDKVSLLGTMGHLDELQRFVPRAEATLRRIGGDQRLQGWIYTGIGQALTLNGRYAESLEVNQKGLLAKRSVLPADHWDVALSQGNVATALQALGRNAEALEQNQRAIEILERALGRQHPDLALHIHNRGEIRLALGQAPAARADFEHALAIWKGELPPDHLYNSYPLTGIGLALLAEGTSVADAIPPLERALEIRNRVPASPDMRAQTMFALARALWRAGTQPARDRARALLLAEAARDLFPADKIADHRQVIEALAAWRSGAPRKRYREERP